MSLGGQGDYHFYEREEESSKRCDEVPQAKQRCEVRRDILK